MTEIFIICDTHGKSHVKEIIMGVSFEAECGCRFIFNTTCFYNFTKKCLIKKNYEERVSDHRGRMLQDGSFEYEGKMLPDGSYM